MMRRGERPQASGDWITLEQAAGLLRLEEHQVRLLEGQGFLEGRKGDCGQLYSYRSVARMQTETLLRELRDVLAEISPELVAKLDTLALAQYGGGQLENNATVLREAS